MKLPNLSIERQSLNRSQLFSQQRELPHLTQSVELRLLGIRPSGECGCEHHCLGPCVLGNCLGTCTPF